MTPTPVDRQPDPNGDALDQAPRADDLRAVLSGLPRRDPTWLAPGVHDQPVSPSEAARKLAELDPVDRRICILVHGLGLSLGCVSFTLKLDPTVVSWRIQQILRDEQHPLGDPRLEAGIAGLMRDPHPDVREGLQAGEDSWNGLELARHFPPEVRSRLLARLVRDEDETTAEQARPGIGVGVLLLVGTVALAFLIYGAVLDKNPMWRGKNFLRRGEPTQARAAFRQAGNSAEVRMWVAIAWLSEGRFLAALREIEEGDDGRWLGTFHPVDLPLEPLVQDADSGALLPRGMILRRRPEFIYDGSRSGSLDLDLPRRRSTPLPRTADRDETLAKLPYPDDWTSLPDGSGIWSIPGKTGGTRDIASFEVLSSERHREIQTTLAVRLTAHVPREAKLFLRGHYYLNSGLYMKAADQFVLLAKRFPAAAYPQRVLDEIGIALGVDPTVFLR